MNPEKLLEEDIDELNDLETLETLITAGTNARIPVEIDFPIYTDGELVYKKYAAMIRPLKSIEFSNASQLGLRDHYTDVNTEIVKRGLCTKNGEPYNPKIVEELPAGVINQLTEHICEISGIKRDKEANAELIKEMMGF